MAAEDKKTFEEVLEEELDVLKDLRLAAVTEHGESSFRRARASNLAGLAFSGGGIRSATFNLGVMQALAAHHLLSKFDYLSTVSGGGFIGGWLSALLQRHAAQNGKVDEEAVGKFELNLKPHPGESGLDETVGFKAVEHKAVRFLRGYSNYLTPRLGLSGDTLAAVSTFLRNFVLMQLVLISLVASTLLLAHVVGASSMYLAQKSWPYAAGAVALGVAVFFAGWLSAENQSHPENPGRASRDVVLLVIVPCALAGWWLSASLATPLEASHASAHILSNAMIGWWVLVGAAAYGGAWLLGYRALISRQRRIKGSDTEASKGALPAGRDETFAITHVVVAVLCGVLTGLLMYVAVKEIHAAGPIDPWHAITYGPPLFLLGLSFVVAVHIGLAGRAFTDPDREWFARLGGFVLWFCGAWTLIFLLVLYATPVVDWLAGGALLAFVTWAAGSGFGSWLAHGAATSGKEGGAGWREIAARIAPWLFLAGLGVIVAHLTHVALVKFATDKGDIADRFSCAGAGAFAAAACEALGQLGHLRLSGALLALIGMGVLFVVLAKRLDINLFSLHTFYHYRLARAYLGASRGGERRPNPFTGFDPADDLPFHVLRSQRPIQIINTSINMTGGDDLAWQTRRAASFAFTPHWAGFETRSTQGAGLGTYRSTEQYAGGLQLGSLMAVSGAAASPNMGYHTSAPIAALLTAFNLRLGRWCGNPLRDAVWKQKSPKFAAKPIFAELTGSATAQAAWINLTDGGHFDNLGVYELIRRRCRLIIVVDAGCDPKYQFEDLANTIRKCWTDLGVNLRFEEFEPMHLKKDSRYCGVHGVVGRIQYNDYKDAPDGAIIYLKSSLIGDEWPDIRQYADSHKDFPHESTADQFFDENQFEAYRHLGYKVAAKMIVALANRMSRDPGDVHRVPVGDIASSLVPTRP